MNQTFIELPNIESIPKGFFDVFPDLKAIYLHKDQKIDENSFPNRELALFFPVGYQYQIKNIPEKIAVVVHYTFLSSCLDDNTDRDILFVWKDDEISFPQGNLLHAMKCFKDSVYGSTPRFITSIKRSGNKFILNKMTSIADYWKEETKSVEEPVKEEIIISTSFIEEGIKRSAEAKQIHIMNEAIEIAHKIKADLNEAFEAGTFDRNYQKAYVVKNDRDTVLAAIKKHVPGVVMMRSSNVSYIHATIRKEDSALKDIIDQTFAICAKAVSQ